MKIKFLIFSLFVVIALFLGCIESKKLPAVNVTETTTPAPVTSTTEQKLPAYNETESLKINDTFETWSRGYWSNSSYKQLYFRVITNYSAWIAFLDEQGYYGRDGHRLEGQLFPGLDVMPKTIAPADFNNYFIVAAMMGLIGIAEGPEIEIKNISRLNNVVNVTVYVYRLGPGADVTSEPYHIVIVKRELLPIGNSTFVFVDTEGKRLGKVEVKTRDKEE